MRIASVAAAFPSRVVLNSEVIEAIRKMSPDLQEKERVLSLIESLLERTGAQQRRWLGEGETAEAVTLRACHRALEALPPSQRDVSRILYTGVYPFMDEPNSSSLFAAKLGFHRAEAIDVKAACAGTIKALSFANDGYIAGRKGRTLLVTGEFSMTPGYGVIEQFALTSADELKRRLPSFTLGEGAAAMVVEAEGEPWRFTNTTRNDLHDLCTKTTPWSRDFAWESSRVGLDGPGLFTSFGSELHTYGYPLVEKELEASGCTPRDADAFFTHCSSRHDWWTFAQRKGFMKQFVDIYARYGNVVSAGVPAAMALAQEQNKLRRGDRVLVLMASAGMTFDSVRFTF